MGRRGEQQDPISKIPNTKNQKGAGKVAECLLSKCDEFSPSTLKKKKKTTWVSRKKFCRYTVV
jgi:preprotein translocase subunit SecE